MRIYIDFTLPEEALVRLREGAREHELVFAESPAESVLEEGGADAGLCEADVAFGQPDPAGVARSERLKWIQVTSSSITRYDTPEFREVCRERGIAVCNSAHVFHEACADHVLSFMLAQSRNLPRALAHHEHGAKPWQDFRAGCVPLRGQAVLIVGFGAIGRRLVELLGPYEMWVMGCRRRARGDEGVPVVSPGEDLNRALREADHVVNILPDSAETRGFFNEERFAAMKGGAVFYNIGRGTTVDQEALRERLGDGGVRAAWLDVTDPEPLPEGHPLRGEPNCWITPHVAGGHRNESLTLVRHFLGNLRRLEAGGRLMDRVM